MEINNIPWNKVKDYIEFGLEENIVIHDYKDDNNAITLNLLTAMNLYMYRNHKLWLSEIIAFRLSEYDYDSLSCGVMVKR